MRRIISNLLTLPYRLWMNALGHYPWCNTCHTIVSGGFGHTVKGKQKFLCVNCATISYNKRKNRDNLERCTELDPNKKERV